jgi:hypothetical protein
MRRMLSTAAAGLVLVSMTGWSVAADSESCGNFGTAVHFENSPSLAARKAKKEHKLVFVLHVSGIFEDPCKT